MDTHVLPLNDLITHLELRQCPCQPSVEEFPNGNAVVVHRSADGREYFEPDAVELHNGRLQ